MTRTRSASKIVALLAVAVLSQAMGNVLLSRGMKLIAGEGQPLTRDWPAFFLQAVHTPSILLGVGFLIIFFALFATALSKADLSFVLPAISSEVVINVACANYFLHEAVSSTRWMGAVLISIGVILVLRSAPRTFEIASRPACVLKEGGQ
jgi:multidrug transporter EmrE-like cation transporter